MKKGKGKKKGGSSQQPSTRSQAKPKDISAETARLFQRGTTCRYKVDGKSVVVTLSAKSKKTKGPTTYSNNADFESKNIITDRFKEPVEIVLLQGDTIAGVKWLKANTKTSEQQVCLPLVLDFASDSNPGGGWRSNQQGTQEEDLCRRSNLGLILESHYRAKGAADYMPRIGCVYVPEVVVIRKGSKEDYALQSDVDKIAVVASSLRNCETTASNLFETRFTENSKTFIGYKIDMIYQVAAMHSHETLVLGSWGCGAFGNPPKEVAQLMLRHLRPLERTFKSIVFAVPGGKAFRMFHDGLQLQSDPHNPIRVVI